MLNTLNDLYRDLLVATAAHSVFSLQVVISICYLFSLCLSVFRALNDKELLSDFLSISVVVSKYMLTTLLMEHVLIFLAESKRSDLAQNVYLALCGLNLLSVFVLYKLHLRLSYKFGDLFFAVVRLTLLVSISHFIVWFKFVVLNIQEGFALVHYLYSFTVLYISIVLGVIMLFPDLLRTRVGSVFSLNFSWGRYD